MCTRRFQFWFLEYLDVLFFNRTNVWCVPYFSVNFFHKCARNIKEMFKDKCVDERNDRGERVNVAEWVNGRDMKLDEWIWRCMECFLRECRTKQEIKNTRGIQMKEVQVRMEEWRWKLWWRWNKLYVHECDKTNSISLFNLIENICAFSFSKMYNN